MAHETVTKSQRFYCVSIVPDICKTPVGSSVVPIPYNITGEFKDAQAVSANVKTHGEPVFLHNRSYIPAVKGDERGTLGGVKSGTFLKRVESLQFSSTKGSNGTQTIQESRLVWMNDRNTVGRVLERKVQAPRPRIKIFGYELPGSMKEAAEIYKKDYSESLHKFGTDAMDVGGKIGMGSAALGVAGAGVAATGVGAPVAAVMEAGAAVGGTAAGLTAGAGYVADSGATIADQAAEYFISGKTPDMLEAAKDMAVSGLENILLRKIPGGGRLFKRFFKKKDIPGKSKAPPPKKPKDDGGKDGVDGGKTKTEKKGKNDKPANCCPKDKGPAGKSATSRKPVHFGTGEEILYQADFELDGPIPLIWSRTYRSGSETEDWSMLGARWALPFNTGVSVCAQGIVFHDDTGRAVRLPPLEVGHEYEHRGEGFVLYRDSADEFTLKWRTGNVDTFMRGPNSFLPHGYQGVNAMLRPGQPSITERYWLARSVGRNGQGISIDRYPNAQPGQVLLRVRTDDGLVVEGMAASLIAEDLVQPLIGRVEQVFNDGRRLCHVVYSYDRAPDTSDGTPTRWYLTRQSNEADGARTYRYRHCLLEQCTTYGGFAYGLEWTSLEALREAWAGSALTAEQLRQCHPITQDNSYRARAIHTATADGCGEVSIAYPDADTTLVTEADGGVLEYRFNHDWLIVEVLRIGPDGKALSLGRREWDADGKLVADIDPAGNTSRYTYDAAGNLSTVTDALGYTTRLHYTAANQLEQETDALGHTTTFAYDERGNIVEHRDPLGRVTRHEYDAEGRLTGIIDAKGGRKRIDYDSQGRMSAYTDCSGLSTLYRYDDRGRLTEMVDAAGHSTRFEYGVYGDLIACHYPDGTGERFVFDADGRLLEYFNGKGQPTRYAYNGHGLPIERIDANGNAVRYRYDRALRIIELINSNDESYRFSYDAESRLQCETGFDGKTTRYNYDRAGRLIARDVNGVRTEYARDSLGQLDASFNADGSVRYAFDALGQLIGTRSAQAEYRFRYDAAGQLIDERAAYRRSGPAAPGIGTPYDIAIRMTHAYDELGNRISTVLPNGRVIDTQRYGSGHWHGTLWNGKTIADIERDILHREIERRTGQAGLLTRRSFDPQSRLTAISLQRGDKLLHRRQYGYDRAGNPERIDDLRRGTTRYEYDPAGLLRATVQPDLTEVFSFDPAGNLLDPESRDDAKPAPQVADLHDMPAWATLNPGVPKVTQNLLRRYLGHEYDYDIQGNTIRKVVRVAESANDTGELAMTYDADNRLVRVERTSGALALTATYTYDAFGRRIAKQVTADGISRTTYFVWDGDVLCQEIRDDRTITYLYEPDTFIPLARVESDAGTSSLAPGHVHLYSVREWQLPELPAAPQAHVWAWRQECDRADDARCEAQRSQHIEAAQGNAPSDRIWHYTCDHIGTPLELYDDAGELAWAARYRTWGRTTSLVAGTVEQPLRFQGQYEDGETGLFYNRYRYYDPHCGRYLTQDPIGLAGGRNLYQYVASPTTHIDPLGLFASATYVYGIGGRIESATAVITPADLGTGSDTNDSSRRWARKLGCPLDDAGHVIGKQLGGRGGKKYVFPQTLGINRGQFAQWESGIAEQVRAGNVNAHVTVRLLYKGASTRPDRIVYSYTINGHTETEAFANPRNCP